MGVGWQERERGGYRQPGKLRNFHYKHTNTKQKKKKKTCKSRNNHLDSESGMGSRQRGWRGVHSGGVRRNRKDGRVSEVDTKATHSKRYTTLLSRRPPLATPVRAPSTLLFLIE